jgi:hypothetical protein
MGGVRLIADCLGGMDDPAKRDWRGKIETRASSLAGGLFFRRPIRPATASKPLFIRAHPCHPWLLSSPTAQRPPPLLNCKQFTLRARRVLRGQILSNDRQSQTGATGGLA